MNFNFLLTDLKWMARDLKSVKFIYLTQDEDNLVKL